MWIRPHVFADYQRRQTEPQPDSAEQKNSQAIRSNAQTPHRRNALRNLENGVLLHDENETVCAADAVLENPTTLLLTITEGKYHQVKRMIAAVGNRVQHLHRRRFAHLETET